MYSKIIDSSFSDIDLFDKHAAHPMQSFQWGKARSSMGIEVLRLGEYDKEQLKAVFQATFHPIGRTGFTVGYLPRSLIPSDQVLDLLIEEGEARNCIFVKIEPYVRNDESNKQRETSRLTKSSHPLFPRWTQMVDLERSEEELLANCKSKTRYNIRLAKKKGVVVKEMTNKEGFEIFSKLYFDTCKRQKYFGHTPQYHSQIFQSLKEGIAHILIAFYNGEPLGAYELFNFNGISYYPYGGSSTSHRNVMASNLLMWEALRFAKANGAKQFDMWGSLAPTYDLNDRWSGFSRFKHGYGTEFVQFIESYDLVVKPTLYQMYGVAHVIRKKILSTLA